MKRLLRLTHSTFKGLLLAVIAVTLVAAETQAQEKSTAREWNDIMLFSITKDFGRPTIHARNLFHTSAAMYDAWAAYEPSHDTWLLGKTRGGYFCAFDGVPIPDSPEEIEAARNEAISFAVFRIMSHRFQQAPGFSQIQDTINNYMDDHGYDRFNVSTDYINGGPAELGNYIAAEFIAYGFQDGANEANGYSNQYYEAQNDTIFPENPGNPFIIDPNLWQPISLTNAVDQAGNPIFNAPPFLSPEWGDMVPFAMTDDDKVTKQRDGHDWHIYHDPGPPPMLDPETPSGLDDNYKWAFTMVSVWQSHLDPNDTTMYEISPASGGNLMENYPTDVDDYDEFYNFFGGNDYGQGYDVNPVTGQPYEPQYVKRGDYGRILAEFWADGPKSYTPPGHWYEIVNDAVLDHPLFERRWMGEGDIMDDLEFDVKLYFTLGGTVYDAAISAWSIKGYYDYIRPVSAIRYMCDQGQSTDPELDNYDPAGIPLIPGYVEVVEEGDPLAGQFNQHVGKIKLYTWKGPDYVDYVEPADPQNPYVPVFEPDNFGGVGWILGENWWPYQRPSFVSPPFAGYISGHSTYSSAAAELLERVTGTPFFPGGMGEFVAPKDEFLHFEVGPSDTVRLQWATYRDASDQCSLSRIWGGIHPPVDDIPGRFIGMEIGEDGVNHANTFFNADKPVVVSVESSQEVLNISDIGNNVVLTVMFDREMDIAIDPVIQFLEDDPMVNSLSLVSSEWLSDTEYALTYELLNGQEKLANIFMRIDEAEDISGRAQNVHIVPRPITIDTDRPDVASVAYNETILNDDVAENSWLVFTIDMDEESDTTSVPTIVFESASDLSGTLFFVPENSHWIDEFTYQATYDVLDNNEEVADIGISIEDILDKAGNSQNAFADVEQFDLDTRNPEFLDVSSNDDILNIQSIGNNALQVTLEFDEPMDTEEVPAFVFTNDNPLGSSLVLNEFTSEWTNDQTYVMSFNLLSTPAEYFDIAIQLEDFYDVAGNIPAEISLSDLFIIDTKRPAITAVNPSETVISDSDVGSGIFTIQVQYDEPMNQAQNAVLAMSADSDVSGSVQYDAFGSDWQDEFTFVAMFNITDQNIEVSDIDLEIAFGQDASGNFQNAFDLLDELSLDTRNPEAIVLTANTYEVTTSNIGSEGFNLLSVFDESMSMAEAPTYSFIGPVEVQSMLSINSEASEWINNFTYVSVYDVADEEMLIEDIGVGLSAARDMAGNEVINVQYDDYFDINTLSVGLNDVETELGLSFYPNPLNSGQDLMFEVSETLHEAELTIISSAGKTVYREHHDVLNAGIHSIQFNEVVSGLYFIQIQSEEGIVSHKLVVME